MDVSEKSGESTNGPRLLSAEQVGSQLQVSGRSVRRMAARGELASVKIGKFWRFRPTDVTAFVDSLPNGGGEA